MGKQPYIPLYIGDWEQDTNCLSLQAEGACLKIVFKCWKNKGVFMTDADSLCRLWKVDRTNFASILLELKTNNIFDLVENAAGGVMFTSRRIVRDVEISAKRAVSGSKGGSKTQAKPEAKTKQIPEYEYEVDNDIEIDLKKRVEKEIFSDELFIENLTMTHKGKDIQQAFEECWVHHSSTPNPPRESWEWRQKLNTWLSIAKATKAEKKNVKLVDLTNL
jgi:uncharacterized protein YdaU (DUF1376 family)